MLLCWLPVDHNNESRTTSCLRIAHVCTDLFWELSLPCHTADSWLPGPSLGSPFPFPPNHAPSSGVSPNLCSALFLDSEASPQQPRVTPTRPWSLSPPSPTFSFSLSLWHNPARGCCKTSKGAIFRKILLSTNQIPPEDSFFFSHFMHEGPGYLSN